jgi:hypothetical protein
LSLWGVSKLRSKFLHPDCKMTIEERCQKYGYESESFFVETEDGYILRLYRVTDPK